MTSGKWSSDEKARDALIGEMDALDAHALVDKLWNCDERAWHYVFVRSVLPILQRSKLRLIVEDRQRSALDIFGAIFELLLCRRKLAQYNYGCPVIYWIRFWVLKEIFLYCKKNDNPVSGDENVLLMNEVAPESTWIFQEEAIWCLNRLCEKDQKKAKILYLRIVEGKSSREIKELLGISSAVNVDKQFARALAMMRKFRLDSQKIKKGVSDS